MLVSRVQLRVADREAVFGPGLPEIAVGTDRGCFVRVTGPDVAARHLVIRYSEDGWIVEAVDGEDVFIDGERMTRRVVDGPLRLRLGNAEHGPLVELGPAIEQLDLMTRDLGAVQTDGAVQFADIERAPEHRTRSVHLTGERLLIGRAADSDLVVDDVLVSRRHAEVRAVEGRGWEVVDVGSHNGTFVNGRRVDREPFAAGDVLMIGRHTFRLEGDALREEVDTGEVAYAALGLTVRLPGAEVLLEDVTFALDSRSLLGVVGPSGSGKSTLVRALTGFQMATEGDVRYGDASLYAQYDALRRRVGYVPQDDVVHEHLAVRRALEYAADLRFPADVRPDERRRRVDEVLDELALMRSADVVVGRLSGGQRKRFSVALELLTEPSLLFLDEPTSGLDPNYERSLMELFRRLADNGRTVVVVTHSVQSLHLCDRVLILALGGRVAYYGPPQFVTAYFAVEDMPDVFKELAAQPAVDWAERFRAHAFHHDYVVRGAVTEPPAQLTEGDRGSTDGVVLLRSRGWWSQLSALTRRYGALIVADRANLALLLAQAPLLGLLLLAALPTGELGRSSPDEFRLLSQASLVLLVVILGVTWLGMSNAVREIAKEMPMFRRERAAGVAISAYVASKAVVLGLVTSAQAAVLVALAVLRQGGPDGAVLLGWPLGELLVVGAMTGVAAMAVGLFISAVARTPDRATTLLPIVLVFLLVLALGGLFREIGDRPVLKQLGYVASTQWGFSAAASTSSLNDLQAVTGVLTRVPSVDIDDPAPLFDALGEGERGDARWDHEPSAWLRDIGALFLLAIAGLVGTCLALRRDDAWRRSGDLKRVAAVALTLVLVLTAGCGKKPEAVPWPPLAPLGGESSASWRAVWNMGGRLDPSSRNPCARGSLPCIDSVLDEMNARLDHQARRCDHLAPFALMYRHVTDEVASSARIGRYRSPEYAIHLDAVFATLYFRAADAWREGRKDDVPRAWRLAFAAAERRELPALGNMLLGMNAHISRDLPYALAATGLHTADGADAEPDVVAVNEDIARAQQPMLRDVAERFDLTVASLNDLGALFDPAAIDSLVARWRLEAIANARELLAADTGSERRAVDARIDANATTRALVLWWAAKRQGTPAVIAARDRHCERARDRG